MLRKFPRKRLGIIGGLGTLAGADLFFKLAKASVAGEGTASCDIVFEQHPFDDGNIAGDWNASTNSRKLYVFNMIRQFEERKVDSVLIPCFISHTFIHELQKETRLAIVDITLALRAHLERRHPDLTRVGILTSDYVRKKRLFESRFGDDRHQLIYPDQQVQESCLMQAIYGPNGIKSGHLQGESIELLQQTCDDLLRRGAQIIVAGATEIAIVADTLRERGIPIVDTNHAYAQYALSFAGSAPSRAFKIGVVGGVGPAATVDFMDKIIRNTDARRDQDHIQLVVEHNPKIPDRTASLLDDGEDPTVSLYAACKKLESNDADLIAIPCNTAHAFVERIQPYLSIPIVNMLFETIDFVCHHYGRNAKVGLLATSGTLASRVYHDEAARAGIALVVPDEMHQKKVMNAIYGEAGVKAGHVSGACREELLDAMAHLAGRGAQVLILGCTELPLLVKQDAHFPLAGAEVVVLDPTEILAQRCVGLAQKASAP